MVAIVRPARLTDAAQVIGAYEWLFEPPGSRPSQWDPERGAAALRRVISSDSAVVFVAEAGGQLVGFCTAYDHIESVRFGPGVWVEDLAVHPAYRSQAIGRRLLDQAKRWALNRRAARLQLVSAELRADAHRFYEREKPDWRSISFGWELSSSEPDEKPTRSS